MSISTCPRPRSWSLLGSLAALALGGCGAAGPQPEEPAAPVVAPIDTVEGVAAADGTEPVGAGGSTEEAPSAVAEGGASEAAAVAGTSPGAGPFGYAPLWEAKDPGGWNHAMAIAPSGDVLSLSAFSLSLLARHDGARLDSARVCSDISLRGAALEVRGQSVLAVCSDAVQDIELPGMRRTERVKLPWSDMGSRATACGFGPKRLAVGNRSGEVIEIDLSSWRIVGRHKAPSPGEIESLAYTPDGSVLAVSVDAEMGTPGQIVLLRNGKFERVPNVVDSSGAVVFSPNGRELFAEVRSFTAGRVSIVDGRVGNEQHVSSWLTAARWIDADLVAATGAHGTALFPASGDLATLNKDTGEGLTVSQDGKLLCSGSRDGQIRCWSRGPVAPSTYRPIGAGASGSSASGSTAPSRGAASGSSATTTQSTEHAGTLRSRSGNRLVIELGAEPAPSVGATGELSKRVATQLGGLSITAWLTIAEITVEKADGQRVTVRIDKKTSQVNVNGKAVDHFTSGSEVRIAVK